ncbi:sister chromatid cohesion protein PDS5 homolog C isoform X1 [Lactuca sativa]|uniref:sister chromatid cohesion protein PDS5 homolog C isoform X1 n=1 Tax=Lactuca sativa TaxID=4236 RepID=UPI0022AECC6C|nr:sister chromatid cohesion protein PDS5 homolog C isoform X1 [Lactuca sativa]XP_052620682.1 sister chromatid cohesion protein PDS5 homolog C isoform X1 [Lactuca sativa]XP_052620683.1 sister chromatid cohesion protein PDS5 homolog C isoform X1 [Lactuca sativa]XP_052620684.1 sister chromatid cohesion protein PDS5 homolog C isoform X1 [Lactuca sativa]XP_052620685.1 sister chromatid cohesion protein PDS5 homolog C isoform X1 [Lactuca sativa]
MASTEAELEQQLKEAGKQLSHPPDSVDGLLPVLDQVEKLLSKVDQSPKKSMLDALKPSMRALIQDSLLGHSDVDVKVAVASCISEITRITAPDAPYNDDQMRDVFQLIVSSFEDLSDQSSRSYNKRSSILETVSKVRSCVIMLDLECDELIVEMFEHFLRSVRDYHLESIYSSMENIMVLVLEESEEVSVEMLKPILASVKKNSEGVLPIARKLGEGVILKSAAKLKPYLMPAVISLGDTLDMYTQVVASVCEGTPATIEHDDENASGVQLANESKSTKGSLDETQQADESKLTTASSDHTDQVVKEDTCHDDEDPTLDRSPKSVMSNGVKGDEEASVDQEPSKKPQEDKNEQKLDLDDVDESDADVAKPESKPEQTSKSTRTKSDTTVNSGEPSDSSHVEGEKEEAEKQPDVVVHTSPVKESSNEAVNPSETEKDENAPESKAENVSSPSPSQSDSLPDESQVKRPVRSKKKPLQKDENAPENAASPFKSGSPKKTGRAKNKAVAAKVPAAAIDESEDGGDSDDNKPLKKADKKVDAGSSGAKPSKASGKKGKQSGKKMDVGESGAKSSKQGKKVDESSINVKQSVKKGEEEDSDSDAKPLKLSVKKGEKSKNVEEDEESDSDSKPLKVSAAKKGNIGNSGENVKSSSKKKDDGKKRKTVAEKEQTKSLSGDDEMEESSPKSATKGTPGNSSKRKRNTGKDKVKYDKSLVGLKVKVWWPEDKTYYEGVIESFDSAKKKHKVSYVDGDEEILNLKTQKWEILEQQDEEPITEAQNEEEEDEEEEASPETHKKKKSKTDPTPSASKDSAKRVGATSSSVKSKGSSKDNKSTSQKTSAKSTDAASGKSKEDEETPKSKAVNKSKGKTPQTATKSNSNSNGPGKAKSGSEEAKTPESTKGGSKSGKKRKKRS